MAKRKIPVSKTTTTTTSDVPPTFSAKSNLKWIVGGIAFLLILVVVALTMIKDDNASEKISTTSSALQDPGSVDTNTSVTNSTPAKTTINEISKKITGDWVVKERLIAGQPTTKGKIGMGSWQFYDDGSLKYTTGQYADLGTWKADDESFTVSLYALGSYAGTVTSIDAKSMTWITNETIDGQEVAVTNRLVRKK